jgi:hypothetical protein
MRNSLKLGLAALLLAACGLSVKAQSFYGAVSNLYGAFETATNWSVATGYGRGFSGKDNNLAYADLAYNFNNNVGVVVGDEIIFGLGKPQVSTAAGGITLNATIAPLGFLGGSFTNYTGKFWVSDLIATPRNGNALGNLIVSGISFDITSFKNFELGTSIGYENRQGQGRYDGNYGLIMLTLTRKF